jgi:hypothetical protein
VLRGQSQERLPRGSTLCAIAPEPHCGAVTINSLKVSENAESKKDLTLLEVRAASRTGALQSRRGHDRRTLDGLEVLSLKFLTDHQFDIRAVVIGA